MKQHWLQSQPLKEILLITCHKVNGNPLLLPFECGNTSYIPLMSFCSACIFLAYRQECCNLKALQIWSIYAYHLPFDRLVNYFVIEVNQGGQSQSSFTDSPFFFFLSEMGIFCYLSGPVSISKCKKYIGQLFQHPEMDLIWLQRFELLLYVISNFWINSLTCQHSSVVCICPCHVELVHIDGCQQALPVISG